MVTDRGAGGGEDKHYSCPLSPNENDYRLQCFT